MNKSLLVLILLCAINGQSYSQKLIIFDTDFGGDADDLGALSMLHSYINEGSIELLAVISWSTEQYAVSGIDAVNTFYGRPDIPIGLRKSGVYHESWNHSKAITDFHPYDVTPENAHEATSLYRKLLSSADDKSITIITVGPLANILNLLASEGDEYSELSGVDLIHLKVKEFVIMGGQFPTGESEWNFNGNMPGVTKNTLSQIHVPVTFLGYEVGLIVKSGEQLNTIDQNHPLYLGYFHFSKHAPWINEDFDGRILDNASYDQTAILYAAENGLGTYWERSENGKCIPDETGGNTWVKDDVSNHTYLKILAEPEELAQIIEQRMINGGQE